MLSALADAHNDTMAQLHALPGAPVLPAAGWLCLLATAASDAPVGLRRARFLRGVRDAGAPLEMCEARAETGLA